MALGTHAEAVIVVDSNAWADYFNDVREAHVDRLDEALRHEEDLAVLPIIVTEVLQGFRGERGFRRAQRVLVALPMIEPSLDCHGRAARLFRSLRGEAVSVRGAVDCVIAQVCLDLNVPLLSPDRDFKEIARHTRLRLLRG